MSDEQTGPSADGTDRYQHVDIHLCKRCKDELGAGEEVVCLSDGFVEPDESYNVENRRFFHLDCWLAYRDLDTDADQGGDQP